MSDSAFNVEEFLTAPIDTPLSTIRIHVTPGEYTGLISEGIGKDIELSFTKEKGKPVLAVWWTLDAPEEQARVGREKLRVRQQVWLDALGGDGGTLRLDTARGKNVDLGRLREALHQNTPGPWHFGKLQGGVAKVMVRHKPNETRPGEVYEEVYAVSSL